MRLRPSERRGLQNASTDRASCSRAKIRASTKTPRNTKHEEDGSRFAQINQIHPLERRDRKIRVHLLDVEPCPHSSAFNVQRPAASRQNPALSVQHTERYKRDTKTQMTKTKDERHAPVPPPISTHTSPTSGRAACIARRCAAQRRSSVCRPRRRRVRVAS